MRDTSSVDTPPPPPCPKVVGHIRANQLTDPPPLSLEVAGEFKADGCNARQRLLEGDLDAMPDFIVGDIGSRVVAANGSIPDTVAAEASSTDLQGLAFQELFAGAGGLTSAVRRLDVPAHPPRGLTRS